MHCTMQSDPTYLSHLGELATLKNTLSCYFHQDWQCDANTEEEVWRQIIDESSRDEMLRLVEQIGFLLSRSDEEVCTLFRSTADGLSLTEPVEVRRFLELLRAFIQTYGVSD
jgi:hypothetical protein